MEENNELQKIMDNLAEDERLEVYLIAFYETLIEMNVSNHVPKEKAREFSENLKRLYDDSVRHREVIAHLTDKFKE
jgi:rRNA pseudouridine-1189 N-methylase Emg1 (Nep1/Mra1 family)